jgi:hypothetical protein
MSPRRARRLPDEAPRRGRGGAAARPGDRGDGGPDAPIGPEHHESWPDGDWVVRMVPGAAAVKSYRCPGCDQEIPPGVAHLVAWPSLIPGPSERRHWHRPCWQRRMQRQPGRRVGRQGREGLR